MNSSFRHPHPLSPPHTDNDHVPSEPRYVSRSLDASDPHFFDSPGTRFARTSKLGYHNTTAPGVEFRQAPRPAAKWLVTVAPSPSLAANHGVLGHNLESSPPGRLLQGILVPLLPTLGLQLSTVAREFNFPSTAGVCLYLHTNDANIAFTPRISDDSWPILWGHYLDERVLPPPHCFPLAGRIELELDLGKARWYDSWLSTRIPASPTEPSTRPSRTTRNSRDINEDVSASTVQRAARATHEPRKLSLVDKLDRSLAIGRVASVRQKVPSPDLTRKSSRKNQLESLINNWRSVSAVPLASQDTSITSSYVGEDEEEEENHGLNLDDFQWSISSAGPMSIWSFTNPPSSRVPSVHLANRVEGSVCLTPTVCTSPGPSDGSFPTDNQNTGLDFEGIREMERKRGPSPDLAMRMVEDAPLTPETCTSPGPSERSMREFVLDMNELRERLRASTPDLAKRMWDDAPVTPLTCTSPGPSDHSYNWDELRVDERFVTYTPDVGGRMLESMPMTPLPVQASLMVADLVDDVESEEEEEEVPPQEWVPGSPLMSERSFNWDDDWDWTNMLEKGAQPTALGLHLETPNFDSGSSNIAGPSSAVGRQRGISNVGIMTAVAVAVATEATIIMEEEAENEPENVIDAMFNRFKDAPSLVNHTVTVTEPQPVADGPWEGVWPYIQVPTVSADEVVPVDTTADATADAPWEHVWPYTQVTESSAVVSAPAVVEPSQDAAGPWKNVWPYLEVPVVPVGPLCQPLPYPAFEIYTGHVVQAHDIFRQERSVKLSAAYPVFSLYPAVYPNFEIYAGHVITPESLEPCKAKSVMLKPRYPNMSIYRAAYPTFEIYPGCVITPQSLVPYKARTIEVQLKSSYPRLTIYRAVYPTFEIYPGCVITQESLVPSKARTIEVQLKSRYPRLIIYRAAYPTFEIYPGHIITQEQLVPYKSEPINIHLRPLDSTAPLAVYPVFEIYPGHVMVPSKAEIEEEIEAEEEDVEDVESELEIDTSVSAPVDDWNPGSPLIADRSFDWDGDWDWVKMKDVNEVEEIGHGLGLASALLPAAAIATSLVAVQVETATHVADSDHKFVHFTDIQISTETVDGFDDPTTFRAEKTTRLSVHYPKFDLYPAMYPYFDIYNSGRPSMAELARPEPTSTTLTPKYPAFDLYPAVYPHFDIYRSGKPSRFELKTVEDPVLKHYPYPFIIPYPAITPYEDKLTLSPPPTPPSPVASPLARTPVTTPSRPPIPLARPTRSRSGTITHKPPPPIAPKPRAYVVSKIPNLFDSDVSSGEDASPRRLSASTGGRSLPRPPPSPRSSSAVPQSRLVPPSSPSAHQRFGTTPSPTSSPRPIRSPSIPPIPRGSVLEKARNWQRPSDGGSPQPLRPRSELIKPRNPSPLPPGRSNSMTTKKVPK